MKKLAIAIVVLVSSSPLARSSPVALDVGKTAGEPFTKARAKLYADGWRADPLVHAATGEYMGLDRQLVQSGYSEVDYCSVGKSFCVLQYTKDDGCLRLHTQGEKIRSMQVVSWSNDCREQGANEGAKLLPADVRYAAQWHSDCDSVGQCKAADGFSLKLKKKYARDPAILQVLRSYGHPADVNPGAAK
jgi:hypothetical protein